LALGGLGAGRKIGCLEEERRRRAHGPGRRLLRGGVGGITFGHRDLILDHTRGRRHVVWRTLVTGAAALVGRSLISPSLIGRGLLDRRFGHGLGLGCRAGFDVLLCGSYVALGCLGCAASEKSESPLGCSCWTVFS